MMYPFLTLDDQTEIVHSEMKPDGRVKVYVETPSAGSPPTSGRTSTALPRKRSPSMKRSSAPQRILSWSFPSGEDCSMPQIFKIGPYTIYFWSNENDPLEPIHVHVSERANPNATKIWLTSTGKCYLCHNKSRIPERLLRDIMRVIEARSQDIEARWLDHFGSISYFC